VGGAAGIPQRRGGALKRARELHGAQTHARAGLIGNPSDAYAGAAVAFAFDAFAAELGLYEASDGFAIEWHGERIFRSASLADALAPPADEAESGAARLILAAGRRLARRTPRLAARDPFTIRGRTSIPRQAGLSGSSAIVLSALRCLAPVLGVELTGSELAQLALECETEELGIAAGPMDRIAQVEGGLAFLDFARTPASVEMLESSLPGGLYVAWDRRQGESSGRVHGSLRQRFDARETAVVEAMARFRELAFEGREALLEGNDAGLAQLLDMNFDLRREVVGVTARDEGLVAIGRQHGAGVKLCGSGGAVVGLAEESRLGALRSAYEAAGHGWLRPQLVAGSGGIGRPERKSP
jgi:glucuronokinase